MGAKNPTKLKLRRPTYKCDECDKKFLSAQALKTHQYCFHKMKIKPAKTKGKLVNLLGKPVKRAPGRQKKDLDDPPHVSDVRKIEYECPQCLVKFSVYFSAFRHIQRYHCVNSKGEKVPSNSSNMIKPVRVETCIKCQKRVRSTELHSCASVTSSMMSRIDTSCLCMGCQQTFPTVFLFDMHVSGLHSDSVETLFFPDLHAFTMWKEQMEEQSGVQYALLVAGGARQTYRCAFAPERAAGEPAYCCPSSVVVKEYSKSVQVNFYKEHHGHHCKYKLPDRFKKYLSSEVMKKSVPVPTTVPDQEEDLYYKFKTVIDTVLLSAFDADTEMLKLLHSKAVEMQKLLRNDEEPKAAVKNMTDDQITETLESYGKRKSTEEASPKRAREESPPEVSEEDRKGTVKDFKDKYSKVNPSSPTFNDSYKEFVDKISVKQSLSVDEKSETKAESKPIKNIKTYSKKKIVKTKIGQFKPNMSPKKDVKLKKEDICEDLSVISFDLGKVKREVDYEVIEQENDCNILILKI